MAFFLQERYAPFDLAPLPFSRGSDRPRDRFNAPHVKLRQRRFLGRLRALGRGPN